MRERGFYVVTTPDRLEDLRRMLTSLRRHNSYPVQVMVASRKIEAHRMKAWSGLLSTFENTVMLDTDMLIAGNLDYLFDVADTGKIGVFRSPQANVFSSGVMSFAGETKRRLGREWSRIFDERLAGPGPDRGEKSWQFYDQRNLNLIIKKLPYKFIPVWYHYILLDHTPAQEAADYGKVKVFHFAHAAVIDREAYKSFKAWKEI